MIKFLNKLAEKYSDIYKYFLFIITISLVVLQFPMEGKFKYEFQKGKPWMHADLIAPFDYAILKTDEALASEKAMALKSMKPYFSKDANVAVETINDFKTAFNQKWDEKYPIKNEERKKASLKAALAMLDSVYTRGIIQLTDSVEGKPDDYVVNVVSGNIAEEKELSELHTIQSADEYIVLSLKKKYGIDQELLMPLLEKAITHNVVYDSATTNKYRQNILSNISSTTGMVQRGERVISRGDLVTADNYQSIQSLKKEYEAQLGASSKYMLILLGQVLLVCISFVVLFLFLLSFRKDVFADNKKVFFILMNIFLMVIITSTIVKLNVSLLYLVPLCIIPVIIRAFFDTRLALFVYLVTIINIGFLVPNSFQFIFLQLISGIMAIISVVNLRKRGQFFFTSVLVFFTYSLTYIGMTLMQDGSLEDINTNNFIWFAGSSLLVLFSYPLIFVYEKSFGLITDVSLMELSDINNRLLRDLSTHAPATMQHSMLVSNLAEEAIQSIGGNALLVRAGALYHDIGKMDMPLYFTENQGKTVNPHNELTSEESASIIISHVIKGIELARKHNLPERIIDFIRTHHGTRRTQYFYLQFIKNNPDEPVHESKFRYRGPTPFSKETAVVMMADSVEAVSRTLKDTDEKSINDMVDSIINMQIEQKQFVNADITFRDIEIIKKIFKKKLQHIFHARIEYPT